MSDTPQPPPGGSKPSHVDRILRLQREALERKHGRPLTDAELAQLEASTRRLHSAGVHLADNRSATEAARAAIASLPKALPGRLVEPQRDGSSPPLRVRQRRFRQVLTDVSKLLQLARRNGTVGKPALQIHAFREPDLFVQEYDLDDLIPDGWGALFTAESGRLAKAEGLPQSAIPLLCLLHWSASFRPAKAGSTQGAGFQVSLDWLARKLGCSRPWVQMLLNRLDPQAQWRRECASVHRANRSRAKRNQELLPLPKCPGGTVYIERYRRLMRYRDCNADGHEVWFDARERSHVLFDARGVIYLTDHGRRVLGRPTRCLEAAAEVRERGFRRRWKVAGRMLRGTFRHVAEQQKQRDERRLGPGVLRNLSPKDTYLERLRNRGVPDR